MERRFAQNIFSRISDLRLHRWIVTVRDVGLELVAASTFGRLARFPVVTSAFKKSEDVSDEDVVIQLFSFWTRFGTGHISVMSACAVLFMKFLVSAVAGFWWFLVFG